jgi:hypothetical protein
MIHVFEWGLGQGLYFASVKWVGIFMLIVGCIGSPNIRYYNSQEYSQGQVGVPVWLAGTAVCTNRPLVKTISGEYQRKMGCPLSLQQGITDVLATLMLLLMLGSFARWQDRMREKLDVAVQTAQDYSICVHDPDLDAVDPDEWYRFFSQWGDVAVVTVALDNGTLLDVLADRVMIKKQIAAHEEEHGTANRVNRYVRNLPGWLRYVLHTLGLGRDIAYWGSQLFESERWLLARLSNHFHAHKVRVGRV